MHIDRRRYARTPLYRIKLMDRVLVNTHFFFAKGPYRASVFSKFITYLARKHASAKTSLLSRNLNPSPTRGPPPRTPCVSFIRPIMRESCVSFLRPISMCTPLFKYGKKKLVWEPSHCRVTTKSLMTTHADGEFMFHGYVMPTSNSSVSQIGTIH